MLKERANKRIRMAVVDAGITYTDLAETIGITRYTLSTKMRYELSDSEQDKIIEAVRKTVERLS